MQLIVMDRLHFIMLLNTTLKVVGLLLIFGADINARNTNRETPIYLAAHHRDVDLTTIWSFPIPVLTGLDVQSFTADFHRNYEDMVTRSIAGGTDVNTTAPNGETALHFAVRIENETVVRLLLEAGADVNKVNSSGTHPLHWAIENLSANIMWMLLDHGAEVSNLDLSMKMRMIELPRNNPRRD